MAFENVYKDIAKLDIANAIKAKLETGYTTALIGLFKQNAVNWAAFDNTEINWADIAAGEADYKGYASKIINAGNFSIGANGRTYRYAQISCNFPYDAAAPTGADSNTLTHFCIGVDDGVNGLKVWYVGKFANPVTVQQDGDTVAFKFSAADFVAAIGNAIQS